MESRRIGTGITGSLGCAILLACGGGGGGAEDGSSDGGSEGGSTTPSTSSASTSATTPSTGTDSTASSVDSSGDSSSASTSSGDSGTSEGSTAGESTTGGCVTPPDDPPARVTGTVENVVDHDCPAGAPPGASCQQMIVSCPDVPDLGAQVAVTEPAREAVGTVVMLFGGGGTQFFDEGFPEEYTDAGLRVVQLVFPSVWEEEPNGSIKAAACRVATLVEWAFAEPHGGSRETGFCAHMHSGGSGALGYTLAHYDGDAFLDYAQVDAGPVFGRIDHGCDPQATGLGTTTRFVCDDLPDGPFVYGGASALINGWENTQTCGAPYGDASPADVMQWEPDSVVSPGADYDYPQTEVGFWYCANDANEAAGQGSWYVDEVTSSKSVNCVTGRCQVEPPWSDPQGFADMVAAMSEQCVPRHCPE